MIDPETGEFIPDDEEEDGGIAVAAPEGNEQPTDIGEYIRRAKIQSALFSHGGLPEKLPEGTLPTYESPSSKLYQPGPAMAAYKAKLAEEPLRQNNPASGLRKGLGIASGIASGIATSDPNAANAAREAVTDRPYNRMLSNYQQALEVKGRQAELEAGGNQAARQYYLDLAKIQHEQEQSKAETARREAEAAHGGLWKFQSTPEYLRLRYGQSSRVPDLVTVETVDGKKQTGDRMPGGAVKVGETVIPPDQIKSVRKVGTGSDEVKITNPFELWHQQNPDKDAAEWFKVHPEGEKEFNDFAAAYRAKFPKADGIDITKAYAAAKEQPQRPPQALMIPPGGGNAMVVRPGTNVPAGMVTPTQEGQMTMPTAATRGRAQQAEVVIDTGRDLKAFLEANRAKLGNIDNYWKNFVSGTPMSDPIIAEFQTKLASYAALQAAAHGFRGSNVMTDFEHKIGGSQRNPDSIIAAINGIESTMNELKKSGIFGSPSSSLPGGVTIEEINAELARRKKK